MIFQKVAAFQRACGQLIAETPALPEAALRQLRVRLLHEEWREYFDADARDDLVGIADALADMTYILAGTVLTYGVAPHHAAPLAYADLVVTPLLPGRDIRDACAKMLRIGWQIYRSAEDTDDLRGIALALDGLLAKITDVAFVYGIALTAIFNEVHRSNMTKVMADGTVRRRADGKILKPDGYSPPDLPAVLFPASPESTAPGVTPDATPDATTGHGVSSDRLIRALARNLLGTVPETLAEQLDATEYGLALLHLGSEVTGGSSGASLAAGAVHTGP